MEDGGQVGKLQFLERQAETTKQLRREATARSGWLCESTFSSVQRFSAAHLHLYLLALSVLEEQLDPGFPVVGGAFKLGELISPQYGLQRRGGH